MLLTMCTYLQIDTNYNCIQELSQDTNYNCIQGLSQDFPSPSSLGFHSALLIQNMNSAGSNSQISGFCCKLLIRILLFMAKGKSFRKNLGFICISFVFEKCENFRGFLCFFAWICTAKKCENFTQKNKCGKTKWNKKYWREIINYDMFF